MQASNLPPGVTSSMLDGQLMTEDQIEELHGFYDLNVKFKFNGAEFDDLSENDQVSIIDQWRADQKENY